MIKFMKVYLEAEISSSTAILLAKVLLDEVEKLRRIKADHSLQLLPGEVAMIDMQLLDLAKLLKQVEGIKLDNLGSNLPVGFSPKDLI